MAITYARVDSDGVFVEVHGADGGRDDDSIRLVVGDGTESGMTEIFISPNTARLLVAALSGAVETE